MNVKIFADGADLRSMLKLYGEPYIQGFTTNPTLMRQAGIQDYEAFAGKPHGNVFDVVVQAPPLMQHHHRGPRRMAAGTRQKPRQLDLLAGIRHARCRHIVHRDRAHAPMSLKISVMGLATQLKIGVSRSV